MKGPNQHRGSPSSEDQRLELRLAPPNQYEWNTKQDTHLFLSLPVSGQHPSQASNSRIAAKGYSPLLDYTAVPNISHKRSAPASVVGWPPVGPYRRNIGTGSSSKSIPETENTVPDKGKQVEHIDILKNFLVKINMAGVPIGRKVDLKVYDSYEKLYSAVDDLFSGLLAAQRDAYAVDIEIKQKGEEKEVKGLVNGISGEYTLVYEDNEGDRMLVGDVPWLMFVATVKRLRVLKTADVSIFSFGTIQDEK